MKEKSVDRFVEKMLLIAQVDQIKEYKKWAGKIPSLKFPIDWNITIIPPFAGAMVRFRVSKDNCPGKEVSVYLDCDDSLGSVGQPYWEIYPFKEDVGRFFLDETEELLDAIDLAFGNRRRKLTKS